MIGALRRIRRFMISENKFANYLIYAAGEVFLIVLGILLALEIDTWNESKKNDSDIQNLLILVQDNLHEDISELEVNLSMGRKFLEYLQSIKTKNPSSNGQTNIINKCSVVIINSTRDSLKIGSSIKS
jgi:hypothetical protein